MRRQLMRKMRKGSLTPSERTELRELDREVNRANRQAAGVGGAGLATALAIASKTGALGEGMDSLGEFLDNRKKIRTDKKKARFQDESQKIGEGVSSQMKEDSLGEALADAPKDRAPMTISEIEAAELRGIQDIEPKEEQDFPLEQGTNVPVGGVMLDEAVVVADANKDTPMPLGPPRDEFDRLQAVREAQQAPYVSSMNQSAADQMLDEKLRSEGYTLGRGDSRAPEFNLTQDSESGEYRYRIKEDAKGGYTPFLRSMRDRIKKKFR